MIFTDAPEVNPNLTLDDLPGTFSDAVGASAESALYNSPVWQLKRTWDDNQTQGGIKLDYETARGKAKEAGVDIQVDPKGMTEGALAMLIERKRFPFLGNLTLAIRQETIATKLHWRSKQSMAVLLGLK